MIKVLYEDNHLLCVEKPVNVPVQADRSRDPDLLSMCKAYLKEKYHKPGNVWLGLVHRLDRPVGGAMVFARTDKAASRLSDAVRKGQLQKTYYAVLDGQMREAEGTLTDWLVKDSRTNTVAVTDEAHGKKSVLHYRILGIRDGMSLAEILLETGRSHQIRVQFASRGCPLVYDQRYHPAPGKGQIALWAVRLGFPHPVTKEIITVESHAPDTYPWNRFEVID
ncbi:MAG: RluA family pseudouridine synthase [Solobacterium sp.]|nr:RluA family pseudouridine synthase [Solobacterium sp.]